MLCKKCSATRVDDDVSSPQKDLLKWDAYFPKLWSGPTTLSHRSLHLFLTKVCVTLKSSKLFDPITQPASQAQARHKYGPATPSVNENPRNQSACPNTDFGPSSSCSSSLSSPQPPPSIPYCLGLSLLSHIEIRCSQHSQEHFFLSLS